MRVFGLTGGIGTGKSAAAKLLAERGIPVLDTDRVAREIVEPGCPALQELAAEFGQGILDRAGSLAREKLSEIVFADQTARRKLEAILHPRIRFVWLRQLEHWRQENRLLAVVVIPLLFETDAVSHFDATVCLACSARTQDERLRRRGWTAVQIEQRLRAQWPVAKKMALADYVVWTEGGLDVHEEQLRRII